MKKFIVYIGVLFIFSSCRTLNLFHEPGSKRLTATDQLDDAFFYRDDYQYTIKTDDKISISVWGQDELSVGSVYGIYNSNEVYGKWLMVDAEGNIELPKTGSLNVLGYDIPRLKDTLKLRYGKWIVNPVVDIKVLNKEITIMGEVRDPQVVKVDKDNNTLIELIARSGGFDFYANMRNIKVLRQDGPHVRVANIDLTKSGDYASRNIQLHPGDVVIVPSRKSKNFDKRVSIIIPFTSTITAAAILFSAL